MGGMRAKKILLATPLLRWYLEHGLQVTRIYQVVEFTPNACFKDFKQEVSEARREGDADESKNIIADTMKLIGNSAYGSLIMDKEKHTAIKYIKGERKALLKANEPTFKKVCELDDDVFEIESEKNKMKLDLPIYLGYFILQYAKLRMLEFYYDFVDKYVCRSDFHYIEMDTDSAYFAISDKNLYSVIKPELKKEYEKSVYYSCGIDKFEAEGSHWFPRSCCDQHIKHDKRTPGLFKLEASGTKMLALCSKTYILRDDQNEFKYSCKGINKKAMKQPMEAYENVLKTKNSGGGINRGFRSKQNTIYTYQQERSGLSYAYYKRDVESDGVSTKPLMLTLTPWEVLPKMIISSSNDALSNYYPSIIELFGQKFMHAEEAYKFRLRKDNNIPDTVAYVKEEELKTKWFETRNGIMNQILLEKMRSNNNVRLTLRRSNSLPIVYAAKTKYWGIGMNRRLAEVTNEHRGTNKLGEIWEEIRELYSNEIQKECLGIH